MMPVYQTFLYKAKKLSDTFGWDYDTILFQSPVCDNPTDAMMAFNNNPITEKNWIATMQEVEGGKVIDEAIFDSSVLLEH